MPCFGPSLAWHPAFTPGAWLLALASLVGLVQTVAWLGRPQGTALRLARFAPALAPLLVLLFGASLWAACGPG